MALSYPPDIIKLETSNVTRRRALGVYQIFGGIVGLILMSTILSDAFSQGYMLMGINVLVILLYCFSIFCGILLLKNKEAGLPCSLVHQVIQVISFSAGAFAFQYTSGIYAGVGTDLAQGGVEFEILLSGFNISIGGEGGLEKIFINILAAYLVYYIIELRRNIQKETVLKNAFEVGAPPVEQAD